MRKKRYFAEATLYNLYIIKQLSIKKVAKLLNTSESTISLRLKEYNIATRSVSEANKLFYILGDGGEKYKNGKPKCIDCGKVLNRYNNKRCLPCAHANTRGEKSKRWKQEKQDKPNCIYCGKKLSNYNNKTCMSCRFLEYQHPRYIDGRTSLYMLIRNSKAYKLWRNSIYERDNYTCQDCGDNQGGNLNAHHKKQFSEILLEFLEEYDQFSPIEDKETLIRLATKYKPFWDINNGKTLCEDCHKNIKIKRR